MKNLPCIDCLTLAICKSKFKFTPYNRRATLENIDKIKILKDKCSLLKDYLDEYDNDIADLRILLMATDRLDSTIKFLIGDDRLEMSIPCKDCMLIPICNSKYRDQVIDKKNDNGEHIFLNHICKKCSIITEFATVKKDYKIIIHKYSEVLKFFRLRNKEYPTNDSM